MPNHLCRLVKMIIWSTPIEDPHMKQRQQGRIVNHLLVDHTKPLGPTDHMGPQPIIKEVWENIVPPAMVCGRLILPLFADPMEGILGDLENPPQCFFNQK